MRLLSGPVLVFGSGGQLGTDLQRAAKDQGIALISASRQEADIADRSSVQTLMERYRPAIVINAAAYTRVDDAEDNRAAAEHSNVSGAAVLAELCAAAGAPLIHISTDYVFDGSKQGAYRETDPVRPVGFYGLTKARGEEAVRSACQRHAILRVSWLYGEFGQNFLKTMLRLAKERDVIRVVADQRGCPTSTRDLARAILQIAPVLVAEPTKYGTYHFAGDGVTTWHGFASAAIGKYCELTGRNVHVDAITTAEYPTRTRRPANSALDCTKFESVFGFRGAPWRQEVEQITEILARWQDVSRAPRGKVDA